MKYLMVSVEFSSRFGRLKALSIRDLLDAGTGGHPLKFAFSGRASVITGVELCHAGY